MHAFLEGGFHADTWHMTWFDAYFRWCVPFMSIVWCILLFFGRGRISFEGLVFTCCNMVNHGFRRDLTTPLL
jgi:hypothetical protein